MVPRLAATYRGTRTVLARVRESPLVLLVTAWVLVGFVPLGGLVGTAEAQTGGVAFETPITEDDSSFTVQYSFDNTSNGDATLVVRNTATGGEYQTTVTSDGSVTIDAGQVGGLNGGDELEVGLFDSDNLSNLLADDFTAVESTVSASGSVSVESPISSDQSSVSASYEFANTNDGSAYLVIRNLATGNEYTETVDSNGTSSASADSLGGLNAGDDIGVALFESSSRDNVLADDGTQVESSANGSLSLESSISADQSSFDVSYDFSGTADGDAYLIVQNAATGVNYTKTLTTSGTTTVAASDVGGIEPDNEIRAGLFASSSLDVILDGDRTVVESGQSTSPNGSVSLPSSLSADASAIDVSYEFSNTANGDAVLFIGNLATGTNVTTTVTSNGTTSFDPADIGGIEAGDEVAVALFETSSFDTILADDTTAVNGSSATGRITVDGPVTADDSSFGVDYEYVTANGEAHVAVRNFDTGGNYSTTVFENGSLVIDTGDIGGIEGGHEVGVALFASEARETRLAEDRFVVRAGGNVSVSIDDPVAANQSSVTVQYDTDGQTLYLGVASNTSNKTVISEVSGVGDATVQAADFGGLTDGLSIAVGLFEQRNDSRPIADDFATVGEGGTENQTGNQTGEVALAVSVVDNGTALSVEYNATSTGLDEVTLGARVEGTGDQYTEQVGPSGSTRIAVSDIGTVSGEATIEVGLFASADLQEILATEQVPVQGSNQTADEPALTFDPGTVAFPPLSPGTETTATIRVANDGDATADLGNVSAVGQDASAFSVEPATLSLPPGENATLSVTFAPDAVGNYNGGISLTVGDSQLEPVALTGASRDPLFSAENDTLSFGELVVGESATQSVSLSTPHNLAVPISNVTVSGPDASSVSVRDGPEGVTADGSVAVPVTFAPDRPGPLRATLTVAGPAGTPVASVSLSGSARAPEIALDRESIHFENLTVDESTSETVRVSNTGNATLSVERASLRADKGVFGLENGGSFSLAPGENRTLTVTFDPQSQREPSTSLVIESDDPSDPTHIVYVSSGRVRATVNVDAENETTTVQASADNVSSTDPVDIEIPSPDEVGEDFDVENVSVATENESSVGVNISTSTRELPSTPETRAGFPNRTRQLGNISVNATVPNDQIEQVSFTHRVSKQRLQALGTDPGDVVLYRYNETRQEWVEQNTTLVRETPTHVLLQTTGDGFSEWTAAAKRPDIRVADATATVDAVTVGEEVVIQVQLTNDGGADGVFETNLLLNGEVVESRDVTVPSGGTVPVSFRRQISEAGTYEVTVNDVPVGTVRVNEQTGEANVSQSNTGQQSQSTGASNDSAGTAAGSDSSGSGLSTAAPIAVGVFPLLAVLGGILYARSGDEAVDAEPAAEPVDDDDDDTLQVEGFDTEGTDEG